MVGTDLAIEVTGLRKNYGDLEAVAGVDLEVAAGEVLAFLGPNGAGKTTTVEILEGLRTRNSGEVRVLGADPADANPAWRERIGIVLQGGNLDGDFTAAETVAMWAAYYRSPRSTAEVLGLVGLADAARTRARRLSGGQQQRLALALALVGDPELVFLDEPTTGFDPAARREAWNTIDGLRALGVTVFLTTHYMDEADRLADRIAVISHGRIVADGTAADLAQVTEMATRISWDAAELAASTLPDVLRSRLHAEGLVDTGSAVRLELTTDDVSGVVRELLAAADGAGARLDSLAVRPPTLEDTYLALTGEASEHSDATVAHESNAGGPDDPSRRRRRRART